MNILGTGVNAIEVDRLNLDHGSKCTHVMKNIPLTKIVLGNYQPRKKGNITNESIKELAQSISELGVLQPIIVRKVDDEHFELIAGERRYISALKIGMMEIPCLIKDVNERDAFAIALIENIQREQLSLLDESESLLKLKEEHFLSVDQVSKLVGKPRSTVANLIRVASLLSDEGKLLWEKGEVEYGHIRSIIVLEQSLQNYVLQYVIDKKLSVRATENYIKEKKYYNLPDLQFGKKNVKSTISNDVIQDITYKFVNIYNKDVKINPLKSGKIKVSFEFENLEKIYEYLVKEN